ncbi:hypothetical protein ABT143_29095 [Streptomyces sp. NPDC002033]|uniref:hypothetical protein n=1 Tax=unclassified Streptomyces TaxID=2593676 RepID=UPI00332812F5
MTDTAARALVAAAHATGRRQDTGAAPGSVPDGGSHFTVLVKPEVLTPEATAEALAQTLRVLGADGVRVLRCVLTPAADFAVRGHLHLHYPRLHRVAADGPPALTSGARRELAALTAACGAEEALGALDAMSRDPELTPLALEERCRKAGIHKLGSGSYASVTELHGRTVAVLNGFLPALAGGYADPGALVALLECHSVREIADLREHLLGALDPAAADPASLRGALADRIARQHGIPLSEGRNGVHLSAGHLEGMFQAWRHFAAPDGLGIDSTPLGRALAGAGVPLAAVRHLATDPDLAGDRGGTLAPHGATEGLRRDEVLDRVRQWADTLAETGERP